MFCVIDSYILKSRFNIHIWEHKRGELHFDFFIPYISKFIVVLFIYQIIIKFYPIRKPCEISRKDLYLVETEFSAYYISFD